MEELVLVLWRKALENKKYKNLFFTIADLCLGGYGLEQVLKSNRVIREVLLKDEDLRLRIEKILRTEASKA